MTPEEQDKGAELFESELINDDNQAIKQSAEAKEELYATVRQPEAEADVEPEPGELWDEAKAMELEEKQGPDFEMPLGEFGEQDITDDPVRIYLREIGRVHLLTAQDEKALARKMEERKRILDIKHAYTEQNGRPPTATALTLALLKQVADSAPTVGVIRAELGLPPSETFMESVYNTAVQDAVTNTIDPKYAAAISPRLGKPLPEAEQTPVTTSVVSRLLLKEVLNTIGQQTSLTEVGNLETDPDVMKQMQTNEK